MRCVLRSRFCATRWGSGETDAALTSGARCHLAIRDLTLRDYWRVVVRRRWIVIGAVVLAVVGSLLMSLLQDPIYEAEAQMLVEPRSGAAVFQEDPTLNVQNLDRAIQTEIRVLEGQRVRTRVQEDLGLAAAAARGRRKSDRLH